jgi:hypothetical protein
MKMAKNTSILLLVFLLLPAIPALSQTKEPTQEVNITGVWDTTTQTPNGDMTGEVTFTQEKETLKVSMSGPQGTPLAGQGTVKEGVVQWTVTMSGPNGDFTLSFKGKVEGEKISGQIQAGDFGSFTWVATKKKKWPHFPGPVEIRP